ncbi:hypothetical protein EV182_000675 [Spiromyces aspiralis]|uniref:Uncharacterized protein n=1 Tax=Spiromyces aspiralis TaxID=68401 RepID=A0ACC1HVN3_9FUNG|nr:hypothetical protein EV182_000675 [Spiromyces aspiralis]
MADEYSLKLAGIACAIAFTVFLILMALSCIANGGISRRKISSASKGPLPGPTTKTSLAQQPRPLTRQFSRAGDTIKFSPHTPDTSPLTRSSTNASSASTIVSSGAYSNARSKVDASPRLHPRTLLDE